MTYPDSVQYLYALGNEIKTVKLGLERITIVLRALGNPQDRFKTIHVAGTNGKGSTCAMVEAGLRACGVRTGLYTSPHLVSPVERIQIHGEPVSEEQFLAAFTQVHRASEALIDDSQIDAHPTYFETVTAMAFCLFAERHVETAVIEVGLGGRLDATNVITPVASVIASIDFDHEAWLGSSIEAIAGEKAGIIKPATPVIIAAQHHAEALAVLLAKAQSLAAPVTLASELLGPTKDAGPFSTDLFVRQSARGVWIHCPFAGEHQVENAVTAATTLLHLGYPAALVREGIAQAKWPGRLERVAQSPDIILDGAHNPAGVRALCVYIRRFFAGRKVWIIYATMRDKSVDEIGEALLPLAQEVILTQIESERALRPEAMLEMFAGHPSLRTASNLERALQMVRAEAAPEDAVFITGSLYLVGEARRIFSIH
jgi:dihydrofolate synthase / folylpolyglutamate synthase